MNPYIKFQNLSQNAQVENKNQNSLNGQIPQTVEPFIYTRRKKICKA